MNADIRNRKTKGRLLRKRILYRERYAQNMIKKIILNIFFTSKIILILGFIKRKINIIYFIINAC